MFELSRCHSWQPASGYCGVRLGLWILSERTEADLAEVKGASNSDPIEPVKGLDGTQ